MGFLDFIFGNKKEKERIERERQEEQERLRKAEEQRIAKEREACLAENRRKEAERQARLKAEVESKRKEQQSAVLSSSLSYTHNIKSEVDEIISTFESKDIPLLQNKLYQLYSKFNKPGGGNFITSFPEKDRLSEVFCLCLQYDWMHDNDIREVWAENGFYCIAEYFKAAKTQQDYFVAALDLFLICAYGKQNLYPKFNDILRKASMHPFHSTIFSTSNYNGGASNLIREFMFFSATIISPVVKMHPGVISPSLQGEYQKAKTDFEFATVSPEEIFKKMSFISSIIGSILNDF